MATRLNVRNETFGQLVRFAIVGFSLAALYSAILVSGDLRHAPMLAVVVAFSVAVTLGFVLHSRWSFRGHGKREDRQMKVKFFLVQGSGFLLNEAFTWVLTGPLVHGPTWWPLIPAIFVTPLATFLSIASRFSADGARRLRSYGGTRRAALVVSRAPGGPRSLDPPRAQPPGTRASSRSAAAQATISRCSTIRARRRARTRR